MAKKIENKTPQEDGRELLTTAQEQFCQLYVCGGVSYAGQLAKCFREVFGEEYKDVNIQARQLVRQPAIMARIKELAADMANETESIAVKMQIAETLRAILAETANSNYTDRFGNTLSPAPLRAVAVNAAKALMELYPVKHATETKLRIEGTNNGVVFNVIVPPTQEQDEAAEQ